MKMSERKSKLHLKDFSRRTRNRLFSNMKRQRLNDYLNARVVNNDDGQNNSSSSSDPDTEPELRYDPQNSLSFEQDGDGSDHEIDRGNTDEVLSENEWYSSDEGNDPSEEIDDDQSTEDDDESDNEPEHNDNENPIHDNLAYPMDGNNEFPRNNDENEQQQEDDYDENTPIFDGAPVTLGESLICILTFALRFSLTGVALDALLKLISLHCPTPNLCKKSLYLFKQHFASVTIPLRRRFYCTTCYNKLETKDTVCENCRENDVTPEEVSYFIEIPLLEQLQTLYKRPGFLELLQRRFDRNKKYLNNYEDIYDGDIYKELLERQNPPRNRDDISFSWNTDGVSLFKSSKTGIWPFYLSINELPFIHRSRKENLLLAGLWFGPKKPLPSLFLDGICDQLDELKSGIHLADPDQNPILVHAEVICGTCDLPAKSLFLNMTQYNSKYGCQKCLIKTEPFCEGTPQPRLYPFQAPLNLRTQEQTRNYAREAVLSRDEDVFGVKGPSIISRFSPDYTRTTAVDIMHCVFLGVVRALLVLWFLPGNGFLSQFSAIVDRKIRSITPPSFVPRLPRSIIDNLMYLKAQELKTWFFYYSIPIIRTIMSKVYFEHYLLFVQSIYLLTQASVSEEDITLAEELLTEFVSQYSDLYGRTSMTPNLHQALHLPQMTREFGPLWTTSCFPYENANGVLKTLVTGTKFAQLQICSGVSMFMNLPEIKNKLEPDSVAAKFCAILTDKKKKFKTHRITDKLSIIGAVEKKQQLPEEIHQALQGIGINSTNIKMFYRFSKSKIIYASELYRRSTKTNSMYVKYGVDGHSNFGMIRCFVKVSNCDCPDFCADDCNAQYFAIMKRCQTILPFTVLTDISLPFIHALTGMSDDLSAINVNDITCLCFFIRISPEDVYIVEPVNMLEIE